MGIQTEPLSTQSTSVGCDDLPKHTMGVGTSQGTEDEGSMSDADEICEGAVLEDIPVKFESML